MTDGGGFAGSWLTKGGSSVTVGEVDAKLFKLIPTSKIRIDGHMVNINVTKLILSLCIFCFVLFIIKLQLHQFVTFFKFTHQSARNGKFVSVATEVIISHGQFRNEQFHRARTVNELIRDTRKSTNSMMIRVPVDSHLNRRNLRDLNNKLLINSF